MLLRDLMCSSKDTAKYVIMESLKIITKLPKELHKESQDYYAQTHIKEDSVMRMINNCGCTMSQDGLEVCLLTWREDLTLLFRCQGECPSYKLLMKCLKRLKKQWLKNISFK